MRFLRLVLLVLVALAVGVMVSAGAQTLVLTFDTPNPQTNAFFGSWVAVGDVNGDGNADIAVGANGEDVGGSADLGRAYVFSGTDGSLLLSLDMPTPQAGADFAVGDVNGDGKGDILVGAPLEDVGGNEYQGRAYVLSGADSSLLFTLDSPNQQASQEFGSSVAMGDVNGDGKEDPVVGAKGVFCDPAGERAYVFSGADGSLLFTLTSPAAPYSCFGWSVAVGEVDGDGRADVAVGVPWDNVGDVGAAGRAYVFSGVDGSLLFALEEPDPQFEARLGLAVAVGDVNGDGKGDIAVGASNEDVNGNMYQGRVHVFSGADGSFLYTLDTPNPAPGSSFGRLVALGDINGDGKADVVVGTFQDDAVYAFSGADGSFLLTLDNPGTPQADFGASLAVGDVSGDGKADVAVGAPGETVDGNANQGRAYVFPCLAGATPWYVPDGDRDCDGFTTADENYMGTDSFDACPDNPSDDAWPADITMDGSVDVADLMMFRPYILTSVPPSPARYDLAPDASIDVGDLLMLRPYILTQCTNP